MALLVGGAAVIAAPRPLDLGDLFNFEVRRIMDEAARDPRMDAIVLVHEYFALTEGRIGASSCPRPPSWRTTGKPVMLVLITDEEETAHVKQEYRYPFSLRSRRRSSRSKPRGRSPRTASALQPQ